MRARYTKSFGPNPDFLFFSQRAAEGFLLFDRDVYVLARSERISTQFLAESPVQLLILPRYMYMYMYMWYGVPTLWNMLAVPAAMEAKDGNHAASHPAI